MRAAHCSDLISLVGLSFCDGLEDRDGAAEEDEGALVVDQHLGLAVRKYRLQRVRKPGPSRTKTLFDYKYIEKRTCRGTWGQGSREFSEPSSRHLSRAHRMNCIAAA
jgi:hypothetical protein